MRETRRFPLSDGSECVVEPISHNSSLISREVDGRCVWGQAFAMGRAEEHVRQVDRVVADMDSEPSGFVRWWNQ